MGNSLMVTIEKELKITITGEDAIAFQNVCKAARMYLNENREGQASCRHAGIFDHKQYSEMQEFLKDLVG